MDIIKPGFKMAIKMVFVVIISFFLFFSINVIISAITSGESGQTAFLVIGQISALTLVITFISSPLYALGMTDKNLVRIGHCKKDVLKGFKIGLIGNTPFFALFILLVIMTINGNTVFRTAWYTLLNSHYYTFTTWIAGSSEFAAELHIWQLLLYFALQLIIPIVSAIAYLLGLQDKVLFGKVIHDTAHNILYEKEK